MGIGHFPLSTATLFFEKGPLTILGCHEGFSGTCPQAWFFIVGAGDPNSDPCAHAQALPTEPSPQPEIEYFLRNQEGLR